MTYNPTANQVFVLNPCPQSVKPPLAPYNQPAVLRSPQTVIPTPAPPTTCPITLPSTNASQNVTWNHIPNIQCTQIPTKLQGNYLNSPVPQFYPQIWGSSQTYQQPMAFHSPAIHTTQKDVSKSTINTSTTPFQTLTEIHETVLKQRQLIGELITFIIHDRLRHDQKPHSDVTDDVDKLLTSHFDLLNDISFEAMSAIRLYKARKTKENSRTKTTKRTRTATSEKRFRRKRHRKWTRSPPHRKSCDTSSNQSQSTFDVTCKNQSTENTIASQRRVLEAGDASSLNSRQHCDVSSRDVELSDLRNMKFPDSRLNSLRQEFTRQLKLLEEEFQNEIPCLMTNDLRTNPPKKSAHRRNSDCDDWKPMTSSTTMSSSDDTITSNDDVTTDELLTSRRKCQPRINTKLKARLLRSKQISPNRTHPQRCKQSDIVTSESEGDDVTRRLRDITTGARPKYQSNSLERIQQMQAEWRKIQSKEPRLTAIRYARKATTISSDSKENATTISNQHSQTNENPELPSDEQSEDYLINRFLNFPPNPPPSPPHTNEHTCQGGGTTEGNVDGKPNHVDQNGPHFESTDNKDEIERDRKSSFKEEEPKYESELSKSDIFIENVSSAEELVTLDPQFDDIIAPDVIEEIVIDDEVNNDCDNGALLPQDSSTPEKSHELMTSENGEFPSHLHIEDIRSMAECADGLNEEKLPKEKKDQDSLNSSAQGRQLVAKFQPLNADGYNPAKQYIRNNRNSSLPLVIVSDGEGSVSTGVGADSDVLGTKYVVKHQTNDFVVTPNETKSKKIGKLTNSEDEFIKIENSVKINQNVIEKASVSIVVRTEKSFDELKQTNDSEITRESIEQIAELVSQSVQSDTENESKHGIECQDGGISLVEWGLVPRRASCKAKERIQKQLCGPDLTGSGILSSRGTQRKSNRQMSLRSNSVPPTITSKDGEPSNPSCNTSPQHSSGDDEDSGSDLPCVKWLVGGVE